MAKSKQPAAFRAPMAVKWRKHRSLRSICATFFQCPVSEVDNVQIGTNVGDMSYETYAGHLRKQGHWAFVETAASPPVVHYWHDAKTTRLQLAYMLGHELGHCNGKKLRGAAEEARADEYGAVAAAVIKRLTGGESGGDRE